LDEEKIKNSERFDGCLYVATNNTNLSAAEILGAYKQLYKKNIHFEALKHSWKLALCFTGRKNEY